MLDIATTDVVSVEIIRHSKTGLYVAKSVEMPTMFAHGRTEDEVIANAHDALQTMMEAQSGRSVSLKPVGDVSRVFDKIRLSFSTEEAA